MRLVAAMIMAAVLLAVIAIPIGLFFYMAYKAEKGHLEFHIDTEMRDIDEEHEALIREEGNR
jgi:hypothetical protein